MLFARRDSGSMRHAWPDSSHEQTAPAPKAGLARADRTARRRRNSHPQSRPQSRPYSRSKPLSRGGETRSGSTRRRPRPAGAPPPNVRSLGSPPMKRRSPARASEGSNRSHGPVPDSSRPRRPSRKSRPPGRCPPAPPPPARSSSGRSPRPSWETPKEATVAPAARRPRDRRRLPQAQRPAAPTSTQRRVFRAGAAITLRPSAERVAATSSPALG